jgi:L-fuconolactonase
MRADNIIDAHHHLWRYSDAEYGWIDDSMKKLRRNFLPSDLEVEAAKAGVTGVITVQARQTVEETAWLLDLASDSELICGVVGWADIAGENFVEWLEKNRQHKKLKGLRHIVQAEADPEFLLRENFARGIDVLSEAGLVYDILIYERQMEQAIKFVDAHPRQKFVLDHVAKPRIADGVMEPWATKMCELAERPNVYCKLSGMVTEAKWDGWNEATLAPYIDVALEAFGPARLMMGSDWPVCLLGVEYGEWFALLRRVIAKFSDAERRRIQRETAMEAYGIA